MAICTGLSSPVKRVANKPLVLGVRGEVRYAASLRARLVRPDDLQGLHQVPRFALIDLANCQDSCRALVARNLLLKPLARDALPFFPNPDLALKEEGEVLAQHESRHARGLEQAKDQQSLGEPRWGSDSVQNQGPTFRGASAMSPHYLQNLFFDSRMT